MWRFVFIFVMVVWVVWEVIFYLSRLVFVPRGTFTEADPAAPLVAIDRYSAERGSLPFLELIKGKPEDLRVRAGDRNPCVLLQVRPGLLTRGFSVYSRMSRRELTERLTAAGIEPGHCVRKLFMRIAYCPVAADADTRQVLDCAIAALRALGSDPEAGEWCWKLEYRIAFN